MRQEEHTSVGKQCYKKKNMDALILFNVLDTFETNIVKALSSRRNYTKKDIQNLVSTVRYETAKGMLTKEKRIESRKGYANQGGET